MLIIPCWLFPSAAILYFLETLLTNLRQFSSFDINILELFVYLFFWLGGLLFLFLFIYLFIFYSMFMFKCDAII